MAHSEDEWRHLLTRGQFGVLRAAGTELPFSSPLNREKRAGDFWCAAAPPLLPRMLRTFSTCCSMSKRAA